MAQYVISSGDYCRPFRSPWGAFPVRHFQPLSTTPQMFQGTLMSMGSSGSSDAHRIVQQVSTGGLNATMIAGILAETVPVFTSSAVTQAAVPVWEANPQVEFKAVTKGGPVGSSHIGMRKALAFDSAKNVHWVDLTASTTTDWRVIITGVLPQLTGNVEGDSGCYVSFRFLTHLAGQIGSTIESSLSLLAFYS